MAEIIFRVTGVEGDFMESAARSSEAPRRDAFAAERDAGLVRTVRMGGFRSGEAAHDLVAVGGRDLVILQLAGGGPELILHPETARELLLSQAGAALREGSEPAVVVVPTTLAWPSMDDGAERGSVQEAASAFFTVVSGKARDLLAGFIEGGPPGVVLDQLGQFAGQRLASWAGEKLAQTIDSQVVEGVYQLAVEPSWPLKGKRPKANIAAGSRPHLVLVHGTFVNTESTFGALWTRSREGVAKLFETFEGVHALEHATLGRSPIENALSLAQAFGHGSKLHLLTHSRGGLVAEVLVRAAAARGDVREADSYVDAEGQPGIARQELTELILLLEERQVTIERVTRVACPVWGTLLASDRLDAYVSVLKWALELSGLPGESLVGFLQEVAATRASPEIMPGLEAMRPGSALVGWVNGGKTTDCALRVVAGDTRGDSLSSWVKELISDSFFWTDNDLVVQTRSMYGGVPRRPNAALYRLFSDGKTSHFSYFTQTETAFAIFRALLEERPSEFRPIGPESRSGQSASGDRARLDPAYPQDRPDRPIVFLVPGILGSHLRVGQDRIWLTHRVLGGLERIGYPERVAEPDGVVESSYAELARFLARSHHVVPFSFDWRKPLEEEARRLGEAVLAALEARRPHGQPVRFLAHSMGGLLVRTFMLECPEIWQQVLAHPGGRLLMLGTPNTGSWVPMQVFTGDDDFGNLLAFAGSPFQSQRARSLMARMPGFVQLQAGLLSTELGSSAAWKKLSDQDRLASRRIWHKLAGILGLDGWALPSDDVLERAKRLRERLDGQVTEQRFRFAERTSLVLGSARQTPDGFVASDARGLVYVELIEGGDGRVTHESACLPGVATWQVPHEHGKLADVSSAFEAYEEILVTGTTARIGSFSGVKRDGSMTALARVLVRPSRARRAAEPPTSLGTILSTRTPPSTHSQELPELRVRVEVGDLRFVEQPLLIGHYSSLMLTGAEAVVDRFLGGAMQKYLETRAYPSEPGETATFLNHVKVHPRRLPRPPGVIVVGLGNESSLGAAELQRTVTRGVLNWVKTLVQSPAGAPAELQIAATLIGSGGLGISTDVSARSVALGVQKANERLRAVEWPTVTSLTLVEIFKDRAREAHRAVSMLTEIEGHRIRVEPRIAPGIGAKWGHADGTYRGADYDLVSVENLIEEKGGARGILQSLRYAVSTRRARTEIESHSVQGALIDQIVRGGADGAALDPRVGVTLFRMLVPMAMSDLLGQSKRLVLELGPDVAGLPWEVLTSEDGAGTPWAISCKLVRKLRTSSYRARPRDTRAEDAVLVIGEPSCDPKKYPRLPGALNEARAVARQLEARLGGAATALESSGRQLMGGVYALENADAPTIAHELNARPYRIVHVAGHGEPGERRGVVLSAGAFLGPREIRDLREVPELVFINCCHLGTRATARVMDDTVEAGAGDEMSRPAFAASVAEALINIGVKCVVAAGWAVDDTAASCFAEGFYRALFAGRPFSDAVAEGRLAARNAAPTSMTWAAYQCYGDPDWTFSRRATADFLSDAETIAREEVTSEDELVMRLEDLATDFRFKAGDPAFPTLREPSGSARERARLEQLDRRFAPVYGESGRVAEAFAFAYQYAREPERALAWYDRAWRAQDGKAGFTAIEQWANLRARTAWEHVSSLPEPSGSDFAQALAGVREAAARLELLLGLEETVERRSLLGSCARRQALIEMKQGVDHRAALAESARHYLLACGQAPGPLHYYPALNVLIATLAERSPAGADEMVGGRDLNDVVAAARESVERCMASAPDFFAAVSQIELTLYSAVWKHTLPDVASSVREQLRQLHLCVGSPQEWSSARDSARLVSAAWPELSELQVILHDLIVYSTKPGLHA